MEIPELSGGDIRQRKDVFFMHLTNDVLIGISKVPTLMSHFYIPPSVTLFGDNFIDPIGYYLHAWQQLAGINFLPFHCQGTYFDGYILHCQQSLDLGGLRRRIFCYKPQALPINNCL